MKKRKTHLPRRVLTVILITSMLMLSGCGGTKDTKTTANNTSEGAAADSETGNIDTGNLNEKGTLPVLKNKVTLTILVNQDTNIEDFETGRSR